MSLVFILQIREKESIFELLKYEIQQMVGDGKNIDSLTETIINKEIYLPTTTYVVERNNVKKTIKKMFGGGDGKIKATITTSNLSRLPCLGIVYLLLISENKHIRIKYKDYLFDMDEYDDIELEELLDYISNPRDPYARLR